MDIRKQRAFTLVELIVVIAVLAVLAAISFSTVSNITSSARDSGRLTDISSMKTALETYSATKGALPMPDNAVNIVWSGALVWSQGTFGDNTTRQLGNISKPKDPKYGVEYAYSLANNKREYELATVLEKATSMAPMSSAYAAGEIYEPTIKGNYNGVAIKATNGNSIWILSVPTIVASDTKDANLLNAVLAFSKTGNVPASYVGKVTSTQAAAAAFSASQVWSGAALPKTDSEYIALTTALQNAYSGSFFASTNNMIKSLLATSDARNYGANVVSQLNGNPISRTTNNSSNDPYAANVVSLLHFDNGIVDEEGLPWTAYAGASTTTTQSKIGAGSLYLNGSSQYIENSSITLGGADFTIDEWFYMLPSTWEWGRIFEIGKGKSTDNLQAGRYWTNNSMGTSMYFNGTQLGDTWFSIAMSAWHHVALVYVHSAGIYSYYLDGVLVKTYTHSTPITTFTKNLIGVSSWYGVGCADGWYVGYIDEFRITKWVARWTSNFTPPAANDY